MRWVRYTVTSHPREEWHLMNRGEILGIVKRNEPSGLWFAGCYGKIARRFRRRCEAKRALVACQRG